MARIAINDIQESESFLTELNHTDLAMDQINGGGFFPLFRPAVVVRPVRPLPFRGFFLGLLLGLAF